MQTVSHSAITLQSWNAAGDEMPLCIQFSSPVILAHSQKAYISIKIFRVAAMRAWPSPVAAHKLCYLSPSLAVQGLSQPLLEEVLQWRLSQENREDKGSKQGDSELNRLESRAEPLQTECETKDQTNFTLTEGK